MENPCFVCANVEAPIWACVVTIVARSPAGNRMDIDTGKKKPVLICTGCFETMLTRLAD